jgi:predicted enzyme related to lactoylglutathione lyase
MHKSQLAGFIIDCQNGDLGGAAEFWSKALGFPRKPTSDPAEANYELLETGPEDLHIELQSVDHPSRVHIDIETDDIDAEVARLEKLGATRIKAIKGWVVMEAPTGHRFCVVRPQRANFNDDANRWTE